MRSARIERLLLATAALAALVTAPVRADAEAAADESQKYCPQWRGPNWNGVASQADPPVTWSETENLRWKTPIEGRGWATPIIWADRIFVLTAIPLDKKMPIPDVIPPGTPNIREHPQVIRSWKPQRFAIVCVQRSTGELLWRNAVCDGMPHQGHHKKGGFASASPVTDRLPGVLNFSASPVGAADRIYLLSEEARTVVVQRGPRLKVLAINELDERFQASPAIVGDAIYLRSDRHLFCFARSSRRGK